MTPGFHGNHGDHATLAPEGPSPACCLFVLPSKWLAFHFCNMLRNVIHGHVCEAFCKRKR